MSQSASGANTVANGTAAFAAEMLPNVTKALANATGALLSSADALRAANLTLKGAPPTIAEILSPPALNDAVDSGNLQHSRQVGHGAGAMGEAGRHKPLHYDPHHLNNPGIHPTHHHGEPPRPAMMTIFAFYAILIILIMAQSGLFWWKKTHKRSYELITLLGLWIFPAITCIILHFWRFFTFWCLFTGMTGYLLILCLKTPMARTTPRTVYTWFLLLYKVSVGIGSTGYFLLLVFYFMEVFGLHKFVHDVVSKIISPQAAILLIWYGLYFGIMGRDSAEVCSDMISKRLSSGRQLGVSSNKCGICNSELKKLSYVQEVQGKKDSYEETITLSCGHSFYSGCIRGWTIVGKKDTCPVCGEKVDLRALYADRPWETRNLNWIQMLDAVRYMVVWNPLILLTLHGIFSFLGLENHPQPHHPHGGQIHGGPLMGADHHSPPPVALQHAMM